MSDIPDEVYVLIGTLGEAIVAHTTRQGAAEELAYYSPDAQSRMHVSGVVPLVVD